MSLRNYQFSDDDFVLITEGDRLSSKVSALEYLAYAIFSQDKGNPPMTIIQYLDSGSPSSSSRKNPKKDTTSWPSRQVQKGIRRSSSTCQTTDDMASSYGKKISGLTFQEGDIDTKLKRPNSFGNSPNQKLFPQAGILKRGQKSRFSKDILTGVSSSLASTANLMQLDKSPTNEKNDSPIHKQESLVGKIKTFEKKSLRR